MFSFSFSSSKNRGSRSIMDPRRPRRRLDRRNAAKNIEYDADGTASFDGGGASSPETLRFTRSLDLSPSYSNQTSFRIGGSIEGEVDLICQSLGLSGPEEFAISAAAWEASRERRSSSDLLPRSRLSPAGRGSEEEAAEARVPAARVCENGGIEIDRPSTEAVVQNSRDGGIKGVRPPTLTPPDAMPITTRSAPPTMSRSELNPSPSSLLAPPPSVLLPELEKVGSPWDLIMSFAPDDDEEGGERRGSYQSEEEEEEGVREGVRERLRAETSEDVTSTSNDDDSSSTATDISPIGRFERTIKDWIKGGMLGSGSFGTVYEGINGDGFFFAVKEVSLLGHRSDAQQCIFQLEQEIALLSQFEHENVVQYYGTEKDPEKLFIFLELVTQGSLVSLYQKYHLQDSQVSAYTRQILKGLNYLHERNVVHRDIKCANILVHASGSVKLADFGLAKQITKINVLKSCKGSVYWMAPEVVKPRQPYGPAADIWSLGCTVLEMLTRQVPYPNMEWMHVLYKVGKGEKPPIPPNISTNARDFITRCIQVNPSDRPSASQLLEHPFVRRSLAFLGSGPDYSSSPSNNR